MRRGLLPSLALTFAVLSGLPARELFVAPGGDDANPGTIEKPLAGLQQAQKLAAPGDTVWLRGGQYLMTEAQIARREKLWAYAHHLSKSGKPDAPIRYWAYADEKPVFDFSAVKPADLRVNAFHVTGSWLHFRGLEVIGVQVSFKGHGQSTCFENQGSNNIFERLGLHDGQAVGIYAVRGSHNLFLNCDAFRNHDYTSEDGRGGNTDGFGCHPTKGSVNNIFRGCRAWLNSDDGYDCISAYESVTFENCWAMRNGENAQGRRLADGNGFKVGGYGTVPEGKIPAVAPRHRVQGCLAVRNRANGFYANHHLTGGDWIDNSASGNSANFNFLMRTPDNEKEIDGVGHLIRGNLAFQGRDVVRLSLTDSDRQLNAFASSRRMNSRSFESLDETELLAPRQADGSLPTTRFLKPKGDLANFGYAAPRPGRGEPTK